METTYAFLKQNALAAFLVMAVLSANGQIWFLGGSVQDLRTDMGEEFQAVRAEMNTEFRAIRAEMAESDRAIRAEMAESDRAIRAGMAEEFKAVRSDISVLGERIARMETRLTSVERVLYADFDPPTQ